jgi:hypothetical protein
MAEKPRLIPDATVLKAATRLTASCNRHARTELKQVLPCS